MVIVEKRKLISILICSFIIIVAVSAWAYTIGIRFHLKISSERVLFLGLLGACVHIFLSIKLLNDIKKKHNDFLMLMESIKVEGIISETRSKKLGSLGVELQHALDTAHTITVKKSKKIASLSGLVSMLTGLIDHPVAIAALDGEIIESSRKAQIDFNCKKGAAVSQIFPQVDICDIFKKASVSRSAINEEHVMFIPVFSAADEIAYFLIDMSQQGVFEKISDAVKYFMQDDQAFTVTKKQNKTFAVFKTFKNRFFKK